MTKKHTCSTPNCDDAVKYVSLGICHACYQAVWKWKQRSIPQIIQRKRKLAKFAARLDILQPRVAIHPGKRAQPTKRQARG